jgi:hypothetical protein
MSHQTKEKHWTESGLVIGGIIFFVFIIIGAAAYTSYQYELKASAKYTKEQEERLAEPIIDLRNGFIEVQQLHCPKVVDIHSKLQLSQLTEEEEWIVRGSVECGVVERRARIRKELIKSYSPHFSIFVWRNDEDADDIDAPVHIQEINIENCEIVVNRKTIVIEGKCDLLDKAL